MKPQQPQLRPRCINSACFGTSRWHICILQDATLLTPTIYSITEHSQSCPESTMLTQESTSQICTECCMVKPKTEFRRRRRGSDVRMHQCRKCHAEAERTRARRKQAIQTHRHTQTLIAASRRAKSLRQIETVIQTAIAAAGGLEKFLVSWMTVVRTIVQAKTAGPRQLRFYESLLSLLTKTDSRT